MIDYGDKEEVLRQLMITTEKRTICEIFRELYDNAEKVDDPILRESFIDLILRGFVMGKKMNDRLVYYKDIWTDDIEIENNPNVKEDLKTRLNRWVPTVSIIFPTRRVDEYFIKAINSILKQTMQDYELIFLNNRPDRIGCDVEDVRIQYVDVTHIKNDLYKILNVGLRKARGKYVMALSDDDYFFPEMIDVLTAYAEKTDADIVSSGWVDMNDEGDITGNFLLRKKFSLDMYRKWNYLNSSATLIKRQFLSENKIEFPEGFVSLGDHVLIYDCIKHGAKIYILTVPLLATRRHDDQMSTERMKERLGDFEKLDEIFHEKDLFQTKRKMVMDATHSTHKSI